MWLFIQQRQDFFDAGGFRQPLNHGFIIQRVSQAGDNVNVFVVAGGDTDDQTRDFIFFFAEAHAFRILAEDDAGFQYPVFRFNGTVRYAIDSPR